MIELCCEYLHDWAVLWVGAFDIKATMESGFILKHVRDLTKTYS